MFLMDINFTLTKNLCKSYYCIINYILLLFIFLFFYHLNSRFFKYINLNILKELFMSRTKDPHCHQQR